MLLSIRSLRRVVRLCTMMLLLLLTCSSLSTGVAARRQPNQKDPTMSTEPVGTNTPTSEVTDDTLGEDKCTEEEMSEKNILNWKGVGLNLIRKAFNWKPIRDKIINLFLQPQKPAFVEFPTPGPIDCTVIRKTLAWFLPYNCELVLHSIHVTNLNQLEAGSVSAVGEKTLAVNLTHPSIIVSEVRFTVELRRNFFHWFGKPNPWKFSFKTIATVQKPKVEAAAMVLFASAGCRPWKGIVPFNEKIFLERLVSLELTQLIVSYEKIFEPLLYSEDRSTPTESKIGVVQPTWLQRHVQGYVQRVLVAKKGPEFEFAMNLLQTETIKVTNWFLKSTIEGKKRELGLLKKEEHPPRKDA